jgi:hypothetical protein
MTALHGIADLEAAFSEAGLADEAHAALRARCARFLERYAALEESLLGGVTFPVPEHLLEDRGPEEPLAAVEALAHRERERLAWGGTGERNLVALLDREGLKIYRPPFPEGTPLEGFFLFDEGAGPGFVLDAHLGPSAANGVAGRLYAHYLLDHDPYTIHLLRSDGAGEGARELRARHFAGALLMDPEELRRYLKALSPRDPAGAADPGITPEIVRQLVTYFEVDARTLLARLVLLGVLGPEDLPGLSAALVEERTPASLDPLVLLPERYVRLALEAHGRGTIPLDALAVLLECDAVTAAHLAAHFQMGEVSVPAEGPDREAAPRPKRKGKPDGPHA